MPEVVHNLTKGMEYRETPPNLVEIRYDSYRFPEISRERFVPKDLRRVFQPRGAFTEVVIEPQSFLFKEEEIYRDVMVRIEPPKDMGTISQECININVWQGGALSTGTTVYFGQEDR
jgi:hypothetical protein